MRHAAESHLAGVGRVDAEDQVAERRLAGAVLAQQAVNLAGRMSRRDIRQRGEAAEPLRNGLKRQKRFGSYGSIAVVLRPGVSPSAR